MQKDQKHQSDEDFELLLKKFIDSNFDDDDLEDEASFESLDDPTSCELALPFPREIDDKVAEGMMALNHDKRNFLDDVASIQVDVLPGYKKGWYSEGTIAVTLRAKRGVDLKRHHFTCYIYTDTYFPMCVSAKDRKKGSMHKFSDIIPCQKTWLPGKYLLFVYDDLDDTLQRIEFSLDDELNVTQGEPQLCLFSGAEHTMTSCLQTEAEWDFMAKRPGMAQFRSKVMHQRHLDLFNEFRKDVGLKALHINRNLLICTHNSDVTSTVLKALQSMVAYKYGFSYIDCSTLFDLSRSNPYEPLAEQISDSDRKVLCLTHINELTSSNGKVIMRKILERVRESDGSIPLWLCGTRQEVDDLLGLFPSLRQFFRSDSYYEQEPYTAFELVQAFFDQLREECLEPDDIVRNRLSRAILQGYERGTLTNWSLSDIRQFIAEDIIPHYLERAMPLMEIDKTTPLSEADIPFEKLTTASSAFDDSMRELNAMIGLENVKQGIMTMANQTRLFIERRRRGLKTNGHQVYHSIFTGNPGTGKTTVARQLGKLYHALGLLSKGEVIAVDRTRLVGQYIGQTEENMKTILEEAKGNVLFIDEAYTLITCKDDKKDFGGRVLDSLLTVLTQPNPDMLIVLAGYPQEMEAMLSTNPGLSGRFPFRYQFEDYSAEQLMEIARKLFERDEFILTDEADAEMQQIIGQVLGQKMPNFGNARWIDQFVNNGIIPAMADRIFSTGSTDYQLIEASDITKAFEKFNPKANELKPARHRVKGFSA